MDLTDRTIVVTGGAGLVGAPLAARLAADNDVTVVDDLSNSERDDVPDGVAFREADLTDPDAARAAIDGDTDLICHLAAADKYVDTDAPRRQFEANTGMTMNVLEAMDDAGVDSLLYTSSSTVYGEAPRPTPEDHPFEPISVYGATKVGEEGLCAAYAHSHGIETWAFRFANVVGPRFGAGVVPDFVEKLREDPETLTILGDGRQEKSYMHVLECVDAMCHVLEHSADGPVHTYNLGTRTTTSVDRIADIVSAEMGLDPTYEHTGGERGWTGDVPRMRLSIEKLAGLGWEPDLSSDESVRRAARELVAL
ncbi:MAG: NAD-dependent epimerase/dehydratase family protein [Halobacteriaceae archaeon]